MTVWLGKGSSLFLHLADSTKHFDDSASDDCEDEPPSASGSFQQIC